MAPLLSSLTLPAGSQDLHLDFDTLASMGETDNTVSQPPATLHSSTGSDGEEQLVDYTEHNAAEVGVLNRLWYKEAVFYEVRHSLIHCSISLIK